MILYINNEHCSTVEQLKKFFTEDLTPESDVYDDLLDYGRYGDIAVWLREMGESEMASRVESISGDLGDSAFYAKLKAAILGKETIDSKSLKPDFDKCFAFEGTKCEMKDNKAHVSVCLKVLRCVKEEYELSVSCNWGTRGEMINPYNYSEGKTINIDFTLCKRPCLEIGDIKVKAKGKELFCKKEKTAASDEEITVGDVYFKMIRVEGGVFMMGKGRGVHQVMLSTFYIGEALVTQALWKAVMGSYSSNFNGDNLPVEKVSWEGCQKFIKKLNQKTGKQFRLPTEAEWEFAARGGNKSKNYLFSGSNNLDEVAWYNENSGGKTHHVKSKKANELGIYDMSGNVWEWCNDWYGSFSSTAVTDPTGPASGHSRVIRGGSWIDNATGCRTATRHIGHPVNHDKYYGFRLALSLLQE